MREKLKKTELWVAIAGIVAAAATAILDSGLLPAASIVAVVLGIVVIASTYVAGRSWEKAARAGRRSNVVFSHDHDNSMAARTTAYARKPRRPRRDRGPPHASGGANPGHGGDDTGAVGATGLVESEITMQLCQAVTPAAFLLLGVRPALLRHSARACPTLRKRNARAKKLGADLVISVHANASQSHRQRGALCLYWPGNDSGRRVAEAIARAIPAPLYRPPHAGHRHAMPATRGGWPRAYSLLRAYRATTVLVEVGYLDHPEDEAALRRPGVCDALVLALTVGVAQWRLMATQGVDGTGGALPPFLAGGVNLMAYEARPLRRQKIRYNDDNDDTLLTYQCIRDGGKQTPSACTIEVFKPGASTAVLAAVAVDTITGTLVTHAIDTTTTADYPVGTGYRARMLATVGGVVQVDDVYFDVAPFILHLAIGRDQLVALDDRIDAMEWAGDEDFSEVIEAVRDELQARIESKVIQDKKLLETMILDQARVAVPARFLALARIWQSKNHEKAESYKTEFDELWCVTLDSIQYDADQDQQEDGRIGGIQMMRRAY